MTIPEAQLLTVVRGQGFAAAERANRSGRQTNTDAFRSYISGEWQVFIAAHPEASKMRAAFLRGAGVKA